MNFLSTFKGRITSVVILLLICTLTISNYLSYTQLSGAMTHDIDKFSNLKVSSTSKEIDTWFQSIKKALVKTAPAFATPRDDESIHMMVKQITAATNATDVVVGFEDGRSYGAASGKRDLSSYDPRSRGWYQEAKAKRAIIVTDMYKDALTKQLLVSVAEPFYNNGQFAGVLLADIELGALNDIIKSSQFDNALSSLLDGSGVFIASTHGISNLGKSKLADKSEFSELQRTILNKGNGTLAHNANGLDKVSYFERIELSDKMNWYLLVTIDKKAQFTEVNEDLENSLFTALGLIILASIIVLFALNRLYTPILALKATVQDLANGNADLTQRLKVNGEDDLAQIAQSVNKFVANLQSIMLEISGSTGNISQGIEQLKSQNEHNNSVLGEHASETDQVVVAVTEMSSTADSVAQHAAQSATFTQQSADEANLSKNVVAEAVSGVADLVCEVESMALNIQTMNEDTHKISTVLSVIGEIADQTNLLALNAAIEAARAGEQGRGFAVVADEVRTLAARTQQSTSEINEMLDRLRNGAATVVKAMDITKSSCQQTADTTSSVSDNLDTMTSSVMQINDLGIQIATAAEEQSSVTEEINRNMTTIQSMVRQLTENGDKAMDSTHNLSASNEQLVAIVGQFKLN